MHQFQTICVLERISYYEKARESHALQEKEKRYTIFETGEMYLGEKITIDRIKWDLLQVEKPLYFFGGLAIHLWGGPRQLANRPLDLSKVKENIPGRSPVAVIEANLLRLQISLYFDFLKRDKTMTNVERAKL
ncbi:uncharacterized protein LOC100678588 [Nasonia vitripennis]|uniref:Uncharacterized protein n=1 Tax=Nasonia vitripennis TaxID=7425 RepID=A0A7M7GDE5_NASVI|nr:uncharacterized protein LOC100678588 [Nasonia vitripennis]XP_016843655.1 uncharacterized protein LOC100678588 [Nasonia vitripennis]XP_031788929.1 uncharacterized protein LOC100678588 [Nasonia vitripennis]XP_031788930.1 uncharacterized protein LOC100678588 [Nasonia vitripennis]XP_032458070.1 uncharacterized protein LOC100678588 [Nasonia vitripennis]